MNNTERSALIRHMEVMENGNKNKSQDTVESIVIMKTAGISAKWPVVLLAFLLFYFPSALAILGKGGEPREWILFSILMSTCYAMVFCINYFLIVPATLVRTDRKVVYLAVNFAIVSLGCLLVPVLMTLVDGLPRPRHLDVTGKSFAGCVMAYMGFVIRDGVMMILSAGLALALRLSSERENVRRRELELEGERRQIELQSLKAQLNPHFLFNSLNNIYALIGFAPERAQQALHELSGMLRFMIYESGAPTVPASRELQFITSYVELMKLRLTPTARLECDIREVGGDSYTVAPLLLLTIVENAFKHSGPNGRDHYISILAGVDRGVLTCRVSNTYGDQTRSGHGVGLANIGRQLGLLYPGRHSLEIDDADGVYRVSLRIELNSPDNEQNKNHRKESALWNEN